MLDATPAPFGEVTRRFTHLAEAAARHLTGAADAAGDELVVPGWFGVAGGVIVGDHDRGGATQQRVAEDFAW